MNRRGFLGFILAAAVAPAIVRADSLMRIVPIETAILMPDEMRFGWWRNQVVGDDLTDLIWDIHPLDAPFMSMQKGGGGILYKWVSDELRPA